MPELSKEAIEETKESYLNLNRSQLESGKDNKGDTVTLDGNPFYQPMTVRRKRRAGVGVGAIVDHITLFDTGKMHQSETMEVNGDDIDLQFNTDYSNDVVKRTGEQVFGLNTESREKYVPEVQEVLVEKANEILGL